NVFEDSRVGPFTLQLASAGKYHALIHVPLLRRDIVVGLLTVIKREPGPFSPNEVALLQTFADQAVIAIENVRLFNETKEALERQTATSEILKVISSSPTDVQPVFDTIVSSVVTLCDGLFSALFQFDGELLHLVAHHNYTREALDAAHRVFPARPTRAFGAGRAILERAVVQIPDVELDPEYRQHEVSRAIGWRSGLFAPMLRDGARIGVIMVTRAEAGSFTDKQIALLQIFADQAVIAIENVRLFKELQQKNRDLTEALDRQTATAEILRVISSSPTAIEPVFETIVQSALRLCRGGRVALFTFDGHLIHASAFANVDPAAIEAHLRRFPMPPDRASAAGRAILAGEIVQIPDVLADPQYALIAEMQTADIRSNTAVPMLRDGRVVGTINVGRPEPGLLSDGEIALLQTFADQAVIAIENVRLFTELQEKNTALTEAHGRVTEALDQQTATSEILSVISSSPTDVQPVFDTIVESAVKLCNGFFSALYRFDGE